MFLQYFIIIDYLKIDYDNAYMLHCGIRTNRFVRFIL